MTRPGRTRVRTPLLGVLCGIAAAALFGCGSGDRKVEPVVAVFAAFPAELAALVERAQIEEEVAHAGRVVRIGRLGGVRAVLAMTGIGLINAAETTRAVLDRFPVDGVVVSGVAGAPQRIGDVTVPHAWALADGTTYDCHAPWLALAEDVAAADLELDRCTVVPATGEGVCLPHEPAVIVGGVGVSDDPFGGSPLPCMPGTDDVFGCDIPPASAARTAARDEGIFQGPHPDEPAAVDMETAAIAREAASRGLPFIAFRSVSDGDGDPLGLPGFPAQFFAYYRLAASTAAATATAFLEQLATAG